MRNRILILLSIFLTMLSSYGCSGKVPAATQAEPTSLAGVFVAQDASGVATAAVQKTSISEFLDLPAHIEPDPTREIIYTIGILVMPGAAAMGESGTVGSGMATRMVQNDTWLSISEHNLQRSRVWEWKEDDRVYFPDRDEWYRVLYPTPSVTARPQIYLARAQKEQP